jgi:syntaxin-binding protein 1
MSNNSGSSYRNKSKIQQASSFDEESEYASSRYVPSLKGLEEYPSVIPMPASMTSSAGAGSARRRSKAQEGSARKKKGATDKWSRTGNSSSESSSAATSFQGGRNMVFMVGGISYLELRVARDVMENESREIVVGSTKFVGPSEFIDDLTTLAR